MLPESTLPPAGHFTKQTGQKERTAADIRGTFITDCQIENSEKAMRAPRDPRRLPLEGPGSTAARWTEPSQLSCLHKGPIQLTHSKCGSNRRAKRDVPTHYLPQLNGTLFAVQANEDMP